MQMTFKLVHGADFAEEASRILDEAWKPPAFRYTPEYLRWQMSFPSAADMPSVIAFDGEEPVGFGGTSARRVKHGATEFEAAIFSFASVRPAWQGRRIAADLYRTLLEATAKSGIPLIAFAASGSGADRVLLRAYSEAGFRVQPLGTYMNYGFVGKAAGIQGAWRSYVSDDPCILERMAPQLDGEAAVLWSWPTRAQFEHYFADPRPRKLIVAENRLTGVRGAGFVVRSEVRSAHGIVPITMLENIWLPGPAAGCIQCLLQAAAEAWPSPGAMLLTCPNLSGVDDSALTAIKARKSGGRYSGYFCTAGQLPVEALERTNLEIV
jgi:predicted N-acetyltransferase YhbS